MTAAYTLLTKGQVLMIAGIKTTFVKGTDFGEFAINGRLYTPQTLTKLKELISEKSIKILALPIIKSSADNRSACKEKFDAPTDFEIENFIDFAHKNGVRVLLKPILRAGDCRHEKCANFNDEWFVTYRDFAIHMAKLASLTGCSMFCVGGKLELDQKLEACWRKLFADIREIFNGFLTFAPPEFGEESIPFWKSLDFISAADGYTDDELGLQTARLSALSQEYSKPIFIYEKIR